MPQLDPETIHKIHTFLVASIASLFVLWLDWRVNWPKKPRKKK